MLGELAQQAGVLPLTLSVDYWDYLGWPDTFGKAEHSARQRSYAAHWKSSRVYTPQAIIDGVQDIVGSKRQGVFDAVKARAAIATQARVEITESGPNVNVTISGDASAEASGATIWVIQFQVFGEVKVTRGECAGCTLHYHNIVREMRSAGQFNGFSATLSLEGQAPKAGFGIAIVVQKDGVGPIVGAGVLIRK